MTIINNDNLTNVAALTNLTTFEGDLNIYHNNIITDLTGLDNVDYTGITNLDIRNNPQLNICHIESICSYLQNDGTVTLNNNAPGCNNESEILSSCTVSTTSPYDLTEVSISPNPNTGIFQVNGIPQGTYQIHDTAGRIIQSGNMKNDLSIDISREVQGVYFMSIQMENETITKRIIKM